MGRDKPLDVVKKASHASIIASKLDAPKGRVRWRISFMELELTSCMRQMSNFGVDQKCVNSALDGVWSNIGPETCLRTNLQRSWPITVLNCIEMPWPFLRLCEGLSAGSVA